MKMKHIIYTLLALVFVALIGYRIIDNRQMENQSAPSGMAPAFKVEGMLLEPQEFAESLSVTGTLEGDELIDLRSEVSGIVENINFKEGQKVSKGQVLFRVNDSEMRAQLAKTKTAEGLAAENERRAQLLLEKEAISQEEYDFAMAELQSAKAETQLINAQLAKATVRAPFSGTIGLRYISEGTYVTPATPIATLVNTNELKITFSVPEKYSSQVGVGRELTFTTSNSSEEHSAIIYAVEPQVDLATRTLKMRARIGNRDGKLIPGTFANVFLPLEVVEDALMVPAESLIPIQNGKKIFVVREGVAREVEVETGARTEKDVQVLSGLKAGDTILTSGVMVLKDGAPIDIDLRKQEVSSRK